MCLLKFGGEGFEVLDGKIKYVYFLIGELNGCICLWGVDLS